MYTAITCFSALVAFVINVVAIAVGRICVDFDSVMLVVKTTKRIKEERRL